MITAIIPTWNNLNYLVACLESFRDYTEDVDYRIVVVDNGSTDGTPNYLKDFDKRFPNLTVIRNEQNLGFVKATNQGMATVKPGEHVLLLNDDCQIVDPLWLAKLETRLNTEIWKQNLKPGEKLISKESNVGAVGGVSNFVMGLQQVTLSPNIYRKQHLTNFLIGFCMLIRADAFQKVGKLDERFLMGGNDDLDYSIRLREAGYKLLIDRTVFVLHYGAQSISRIGGYDKVEKDTRPLLVEKWGQAKVDELFQLPEGMDGLHQSKR